MKPDELREGEQQMWAVWDGVKWAAFFETERAARTLAHEMGMMTPAREPQAVAHPVAVRVLSPTEPTTAGTGESDVAETKNGAHAVSVPPSPLTELEQDRARLAEELLREVLSQGVEFGDARMRYVVMQVDRTLLAAIEKFLAPTDPSSAKERRTEYGERECFGKMLPCCTDPAPRMVQLDSGHWFGFCPHCETETVIDWNFVRSRARWNRWMRRRAAASSAVSSPVPPSDAGGP